MGQPLGQLPLGDDEGVPARRRFSTIDGAVMRTGLIVQVDFVAFDRLVDGPPALLRWLANRKCAGMKYEFQMGY